jgi:outer membrane protein assembly factor BamE (lipoprotein component of BamABCDE complex)
MFLSACSRVTPENFDKIKVGMTSDQVKAIFGSPTESQTQGALGLSSTTFTYKKRASEVKIIFLNDKVMAKNGDLK